MKENLQLRMFSFEEIDEHLIACNFDPAISCARGIKGYVVRKRNLEFRVLPIDEMDEQLVSMVSKENPQFKVLSIEEIDE
ncbi:hypothetical protein WN943_010704 [Citrus x changshan-huyou]